MPFFEYKCQKCGKTFELLTHSRKNITCSNCGSDDVKRLYSAPAYIKTDNSTGNSTTCCGSSKRCEIPPCSDGSCIR